jgi:tripartite-type tricarboxylate transporter receptor subunit TctC
MTHVPYKGGAPANQDLIGGQVDIYLAPFGKNYVDLQKEGRIKILAMLNKERLEGVKQYPAISESKQLKNFEFNIWTGYFVKKDTPEAVVQTLHKALTETLNDAGVRAGLETNSLLIAKPLPLSELNKVYSEGTAQFRAIAKSINLQPQ